MEFDGEDSCSDIDFQMSSSESSSGEGSSEGNENTNKISPASSFSTSFNTDSEDDDYDERSYLIGALILSGDTDGVKSLIESGIDVNIPIDEKYGLTNLTFAIRNNNKDIFKLLLEHPLIDVDQTNRMGETALFDAAEAESTFFLSELLQKGASTTFIHRRYKRTALHIAVLYAEDDRAIRLLVESGADVNAKSIANETPLNLACKNCSIEIICFLMYHGACADTSTVDCFISASLNNRPDVEDLLFDYVFDNLHCYHLDEIVQILINSSQAARVLETIAEIDCEFADLITLTSAFPKFDSNGLEVLSSKFPYVLELLTEDASILYSIIGFFRCWFIDHGPNKKTIQNLSILINGVIGDSVLDQISNEYNDVSDIINFGKNDELRDIIEDFCYQLAVRGYRFSVSDFRSVEVIFGLNSSLARFLILLNIRSRRSYFLGSYWARILLDLSYKIGDPLEPSYLYSESLSDLSRFSALPKVKKICETFHYEKSLQKRVEELPTVPSLTELARNSVREMLVEKCNLRKCSIYYAVIDRLGIPKACKDILIFKQELYP